MKTHEDDTWAGAIGRDIGRYLVMLLIVFAVLKACDLVDWSWAAVLIPLWCEIANAIVCGIISVIETSRRETRLDELEVAFHEAIHEVFGKGGGDDDTRESTDD